MLKKYVTFALMALLLTVGFSSDADAKTKAKKKKNNVTSVSKKSKKKNRHARYKRYRKSGNGPDLRALTTETPNTEFIETPDNGVNSVETKAGL